MLKGQLWYDNSQATLAERIMEAARYYRRRYDEIPEICLISAQDQALDPDLTCLEVDGQMIAIRPWEDAAAGHMWIGIDEPPENGKGRR